MTESQWSSCIDDSLPSLRHMRMQVSINRRHACDGRSVEGLVLPGMGSRLARGLRESDQAHESRALSMS